MARLVHWRPSPSMVVALLALIVAGTGTALAASHLVSGDKLIRKRSLSGDRLRNHTITGRQLNMRRLGAVPSASNAMALGGLPPAAYESASNFIRSGLVRAAAGQTVEVAAFGPFTLSLKCTAGTGQPGAVSAELDATSTEANSDGYGFEMATPGQAYRVLGPVQVSVNFHEDDDDAADFFTPSGKTYIADLTVGENYLGSACFANGLVMPS